MQIYNTHPCRCYRKTNRKSHIVQYKLIVYNKSFLSLSWEINWALFPLNFGNSQKSIIKYFCSIHLQNFSFCDPYFSLLLSKVLKLFAFFFFCKYWSILFFTTVWSTYLPWTVIVQISKYQEMYLSIFWQPLACFINIWFRVRSNDRWLFKIFHDPLHSSLPFPSSFLLWLLLFLLLLLTSLLLINIELFHLSNIKVKRNLSIFRSISLIFFLLFK